MLTSDEASPRPNSGWASLTPTEICGTSTASAPLTATRLAVRQPAAAAEHPAQWPPRRGAVGLGRLDLGDVV